jgi:hypothetical protein
VSLEITGIPNPITDYLHSKHAELLKEHHRSGKYAEGRDIECEIIACDVAQLSLQLGEHPRLVAFANNGNPILPRIFDGKVSWAGHTACAIGDTVLDPIVGEPISLETYKEQIFTEPVNSAEYISQEHVDGFIQVVWDALFA